MSRFPGSSAMSAMFSCGYWDAEAFCRGSWNYGHDYQVCAVPIQGLRYPEMLSLWWIEWLKEWHECTVDLDWIRLIYFYFYFYIWHVGSVTCRSSPIPGVFCRMEIMWWCSARMLVPTCMSWWDWMPQFSSSPLHWIKKRPWCWRVTRRCGSSWIW